MRGEFAPGSVEGISTSERIKSLSTSRRIYIYTASEKETPLLLLWLRLTHFRNYSSDVGGLVAESLACWTEAQKDPGSNRSRDAVGQHS